MKDRMVSRNGQEKGGSEEYLRKVCEGGEQNVQRPKDRDVSSWC